MTRWINYFFSAFLHTLVVKVLKQLFIIDMVCEANAKQLYIIGND